MAKLTIRLLGTFHASIDAKPVTQFESNKVRALLAYLAVEPGATHRREKLAALLWPEMPEKRARSNLSQALYNLRHLIKDQQAQPPYLNLTNTTAQFNLHSNHWCDATEFKRITQTTPQNKHPALESCRECIPNLQRAVEIYRGDFLQGLTLGDNLEFEEWRRILSERFLRQALQALERLTTYYENQNDIQNALGSAWRQVEFNPIDETAHRHLMRLLAASGQRTQALAQFERLKLILSEELDVAPEEETASLCESIRKEPSSSKQPLERRHNLPASLSQFIGRKIELGELEERLLDPACRLITVLGPGGSGKSQLALQAARTTLGTFQHGVFFVPLNPVASAETFIRATMDAIGLPANEKEETQTHLLNYLRDRRLLMVMDGFEHLLQCAGWLTAMLHAGPHVKILVTSRSRLNIKAEHLYPLPGMRYPESADRPDAIIKSDAVQLFLAGARRVNPEFEPGEADLTLIRKICRQVEGMPLGILLASSWMATLRLEEIVAEIESGLDFLEMEWADVPARQRSMRATFDYSWGLLTRQERKILESLSIFRCGFTRKAAFQVCEATNHELRALVDKSLLLNRQIGRYDMHELLRQYCAEKLLASPETQNCVYARYSAYYADALERWTPEIKSPRQEEALDRIDIEHENLRAAWNWAARQGNHTLLASMLEGLCLYYDLRVRYQEGLSACRLAIVNMASTHKSADVLLRAQCQIWESRFYRGLGQDKPARDLMAESQALLESADEAGLDTRRESAFLDLEMGQLVHDSDLKTARELYLRSIQSFQDLGDDWRAATSMPLLVYCATHRGDYAEAKAWLDKCLPLLHTHGDPRSLAKGLRYKSNLLSHMGQLNLALEIMQEAFSIYQSLGDQANIAEGLLWLALAFGYHGRFPEALDMIERSLALYLELGSLNDIATLYFLLGMGKLHSGEYPEVKEYILKSLSLAPENGYRRDIGASLMTLGMLSIKEADPLGAAEHLREAITHSRNIQNRDELGAILATLGYATFIQQGESREALGYLCEALEISIEIRTPFTLYYTFPPIAVILARRGEHERALEIYSLVMQNPYVANNCWFEDVYGSQIAALTKNLPEEVAAAAQERGRQLDLWETVSKLIDEFNCTNQ